MDLRRALRRTEEQWSRSYKELEYGFQDDIRTDVVYIVNLLDTPECERHECCGASLSVNDVVQIQIDVEDRMLRTSAKRFEYGMPCCTVGYLHDHVTMHGNRYFQDSIAQVVEIFDDDSVADFFSEKFASELKKFNGVAKCITLN